MSILNYMEAFTSTVKAGSFTAAAKQLGVSKSCVSKQVSQLESDLGTRLLHRTTRQLSLSHDGEQFYQHCQLIVAEATKAKAEIMDSHKQPRGLIKLTIPQSFVLSEAGAVLIKFQHHYPDIDLEITTSGSSVDLVGEGIDLALRIGELKDSTMMCRKLMDCEFQVVASPAYLKKMGKPKYPEELAEHNCLIYRASHLRQQWSFRSKNNRDISINAEGHLSCNDGQYLLNATLNGLGVCFGPSIMFKQFLGENKLCLLLEDYYLPAVSVSAIYPLNRNLPQRVRLLIDFLAQELSA